MAKTTARSRGWGTRAGNPLSEADGPPRRTVRPAGTSGPASGPTCTRLPSPPPTRRPLPKEGSHRQPKDTAASRGPAPERAPPGCGRRRKREGGRRGIGSATRAAAARARPNLAGACGSKTLPDGAAGHVAGRRNGIEGRSAGVPREPREQPRCPERADVRVLSQTTHAQKPRDGNRTPLQATPARTTSLSGSTRTGRRRRRRRRRPRPRRPRSPARGPSASVTRPPQTLTGAFLSPPRGSQPTGPRRHAPGPDTSLTPRRRPTLTERSPPGTGQGNGRRRGGGEEGAPTRAARERERRTGGGRPEKDPRGGGAVRRTRDAAHGARPPHDRHRRRRPHASGLGETEGPHRVVRGALRTDSQPRDTPSRGEGEAIDRQATLRQA